MNPIRMPVGRRLLLGCALAATLLIAAPASGAVREVPQDYPNIQAAVDAANPGDTIAISKKTNFQHVNVPTPNLLIKGVKKSVVVDGYINGVGSGEHFNITANGVRIVNLGIKNGQGIDCNSSNGCTIKNLRYSGQLGTYCFYSSGDRARVVGSTLRHCGNEGVYASSDDARIIRNSIARTDEACISVNGHDAIIRGNRVRGCEDDDAIYVSGDRALIENNSARGADGSIIAISGNNARILSNRGGDTYDECYDLSGDNVKFRKNIGTNCHDYGVDLSGDNPQVVANRMRGTDGYGYYLDCPGPCGGTRITDNAFHTNSQDYNGMYVTLSTGGSPLIARNTVVNASDYGLEANADGARIVGNVVRTSNNEHEPALYINGDDNTVRGNRSIGNGGDGFDIDGDDNLLVENLARANGGDGFYVDSLSDGSQLNANLAFGNGADGFENDGTNTAVRRNRAANNHRDCANDGTIAVKKKNKCADGSNFNQPGTASRVKHRRR
jgi:hypothetical protein